MHSNTVNTQGRAGPLRVGHGAGSMPDPLTFSHKSLRSELPLWEGQLFGALFGEARSVLCCPIPVERTLKTPDLFNCIGNKVTLQLHYLYSSVLQMLLCQEMFVCVSVFLPF